MRPSSSHFLAVAAVAVAFAIPAAAAAEPVPVQGFISPMGEPFHARLGLPYPSADWFAKADADHDGVVTREEFRADAMRFFKTLDVNADGRINDAEVNRYERVVAPEIVAAAVDTSALSLQATGDGEDGPKHTRLSTQRQGAAFFGLLNDAEPVRSADTDFNMKVTQDEWLAAADRRFRSLDAAGKGGLRLADLPVTPTQAQFARQK